MRNTRIFGSVVALALAASAVAASAQGTAAARTRPSPDQTILRGSEASGPIVHLATGASLPEQIEGFTRTKAAALSAEDVFSTYSWKDKPTEVTASVYMFRPGKLPEHSMKGSVAAFAALSPTAFLWSSGPFDIPTDPPLHASKTLFKTGIGPDTVMDYLYFVPMGRWTVKVRATLTGVTDKDSEERIDAFVRALPWAGLLAANGPCGGAACTAPAFDTFRSHFGEMMLGKLIAQMMKFDARKEAKLPVVAEAEGFAAKIAIRRSNEGPAILVASVPKLATYRIVKLPDPVKELFVKGYGRMSIEKPLHALVIDTGAGLLIPRFYNGEPTADAFARDIDGLVTIGTGNPFLPVKDFAVTLAE